MPSPTYQQRVEGSDDRSAMLDKVYRARLRLGELESACDSGEARIRAAQSRLDSIPAYDRGWMIEVIAVLALVSIVLEWYPARMMSLVFFFASKVELIALTAAFAVGGFLLGLLLGELLRRHRKPQTHAALDWVFLAFAAVAVTAFLGVGYQLRFAYAHASSDAAQSPIGPGVQALALTTLAFIGIVIAFTSGYYRESVEALRVRWRLAGLHGRIRTSQKHLETTRAELEAAERAYRLVADGDAAPARERFVRTIRQDDDPPAPADAPSVNGVGGGGKA
ncbi:MAG TPA: hypothetical protein VGD01_19730 [Candidatus Elarobacter sp.]|jgi:hypothetical protein